MVTQFHTLLHFVTLFPMILSLSASVAASIRIMGVSKSHLLSIYACKRISHKPLQRGLYTHAILNPPVYGSVRSVNNQFHTVYMIFLYGPCCTY
jgi:hypothetical protein